MFESTETAENRQRTLGFGVNAGHKTDRHEPDHGGSLVSTVVNI
jgi:hypothetical protein